jgi:hypothetical protein
VNFGESGYVSTQSVITLLMQLQSGNVPDLVLFYDGPNNVYAGYQSGRAGVHQNMVQVAARVANEKGPPTFVERLRSLYSYSLIQNVMGKAIIAEPRPDGPPVRELVTYETMGISVTTLSDLIVQDYFGNYKIVSALAQKYGFNYFLFWQPIVSMGSKPLTGEEQEIRRRLEMEGALSKLVTSAYQAMELASSKYPNFHYMAHLFDGYDAPLYIDEWHVTPIGNRLIAQKMLDVLKARRMYAANVVSSE